MKKVTLFLILITILSKLLGFIREVVLAYFFGTNIEADAYLIAILIPTSILTLVGVAITTSYIPVFSKYTVDEEHKKILLTEKVFSFLSIVCFGVFVFMYFFTPLAINIFASGFSSTSFDLATSFTKITAFSVFFLGAVFLLSGYLNLKNSFIIPGVIGIPYNILIIVSIILGFYINEDFLAIGFTFASIIQFVILYYFSKKSGIRLKPNFNFKDKDFMQVIKLSIPILIGFSINEINTIIDKTLASQIAIGGVSALSYASRLNQFVQGIIVMSIATIMFPKISKLFEESNISEFRKEISGTFKFINYLIIPTCFFVIFNSQDIVKLLFGRGAFDNTAINITSSVLLFYSFGMIGIAYREILSRIFYSMKKSKTVAINTSVGVIVNIILNYLLSRIMGLDGLALATSISVSLTAILLFFQIPRKIRIYNKKTTFKSLVKISLATFLMLCTYEVVLNIDIFSSIDFNIFIGISISGLVYILATLLLKVDVIIDLASSVNKKLKEMR